MIHSDRLALASFGLALVLVGVMCGYSAAMHFQPLPQKLEAVKCEELTDRESIGILELEKSTTDTCMKSLRDCSTTLDRCVVNYRQAVENR